jgi:agmatine deiminase
MAGNTAPDYRATDVVLIETRTPAKDGFYMPAEWAPHERTIMAFPPVREWGKARLWEVAKLEWAETANVISEFEPVLMVVHPGEEQSARRMLNSNIDIVELSIDSAWARDTGPMVLVNAQGERRVAGFTFNGWGEKKCVKSFKDDALLKAWLSSSLGLPMYVAPMVLEGGAVALDGEGTIITTEQCLLNKNRNPNLTNDKDRVEILLKQYLGAEKVIWLEKGLVPDEITDGHVDGICAFAGPGRVLLHRCDDESDENSEIYWEARHRIEQTTDARGRKLEIIDLPLAKEMVHMNFYLANSAVIVPIADDRRQDDVPLGILREVFPKRTIKTVVAKRIYKNGGGIHCITQQVPRV